MRSDPPAHGPFQPKLTEVWIPSSKVSVHPQICSFESGTNGDVGRKSSNHHRQKIGVILPCGWLDFPKCKSHIALCISAQTVLCTQGNRALHAFTSSHFLATSSTFFIWLLHLFVCCVSLPPLRGLPWVALSCIDQSCCSDFEPLGNELKSQKVAFTDVYWRTMAIRAPCGANNNLTT